MPDTNNGVTTKQAVRTLPCKLSDDEIRLRGIDLAHANTEFAETKEAQKEAAKNFRDALDRINDRIHELKNAVSNGVEIRDVDVEFKIDAYLGGVTITRLDTGEVVEKRQATSAELQGVFDFEGAG